jgi:peptide/nickel transport system ATP-binding protein/peptide/nickel transport system permease protein
MARRSKHDSLWRRATRTRLARFAAVGLGLIALFALIAPLLPLAPPNATHLGQRLLPPLSAGHFFGTDALGRDELSRLLAGLRLSVLVAFAGTLAAAAVGTAIGIASGYFGRFTDTLLMRGIDVLMAFPYLLLALAIVAALGPSLAHATLAIAIVNVPFFARTVRGSALTLAREDFVVAARGLGSSAPRILWKHLLPNVMPVVVVAMSTTLGWMILETAGLSFLGLGAQPPRADLGGMLGQARHVMAIAPHVTLVPGLTILVVVVFLNLLGDGLRDALDPRESEPAKRASRRRPRRNYDGAAPQTRRGDPNPANSSHSDSSAEPLLEVSGLSVAFGDDLALSDLSFSIAPGERVGLVGASGSGKSLTARSVLGLLDPAARRLSGSVRLRGRDLGGAEAPRDWRGNTVAYVPQNPLTSLHPLYPVGEQVAEALRLHQGLTPRAARGAAAELLERVRIPAARERTSAFPHELSGGMRQRVLIAMAIANRPALIVADEPTTALDVTTQAQVLELLRELCEQDGTALLLITHDLGAVCELCERMLVLSSGELVESGSAERVMRAPEHPSTRELVRMARGGEGLRQRPSAQ